MAAQEFRPTRIAFTICFKNKTEQQKNEILAHFQDFNRRSQMGPEIPGLRFIIASPEEGEKDGNPHIQGYAEARTNQRLTWWKKLLKCDWAHIEAAKADAAANITYVTKDVLKAHPWAMYHVDDTDMDADATDDIPEPVNPPPLVRSNGFVVPSSSFRPIPHSSTGWTYTPSWTGTIDRPAPGAISRPTRPPPLIIPDYNPAIELAQDVYSHQTSVPVWPTTPPTGCSCQYGESCASCVALDATWAHIFSELA